jgi:hypothetical protein
MRLAFLPVALAAALPAQAQGPSAPGPAAARAEVLVLGVYHMANPGRDIFNMQADDVLAPAGRHELTRNEIEQIGFRLARKLGHPAVYPVDADGEFPFQRVVNYAKASGRSQELDALQAEVGAMVKAQGEYLAAHTVLETLLYMNAEAKVAQDVGFYYRELHLGEPGDWAGADLVADWFRRNARISSNITRLMDSPGERVLAIFGSGHLGWLRHNVRSDPTLRLRTLEEFTAERPTRSGQVHLLQEGGEPGM